ncbi:MAG: hypothetical protein LPK00_13290 [Bacillaceae bacterium]|nr:hypothetical protein [Bacillaceae bacterium]
MKWNRIVSITIMLILSIGIISTWGSVIYNIKSYPPQSKTISINPNKEINDLEKVIEVEKESKAPKQVSVEKQVTEITLEDGLTSELLRDLGITETNMPIDQLLSILNIK